MVRWHVHGYDGKLQTLPAADATLARASVPLLLQELQLTALREAMLPNRVLANLRAMCHGAALPGTLADQHRWASESTDLWRNTANTQEIVLRWLTSAALDTRGAVLKLESVYALLTQSDLDAIRADLHAAVTEHCVRFDRMGEHQ
jgi:hypothetical protein